MQTKSVVIQNDDTLVLRARQAINLQDFDTAIGLLTKYITSHPNHYLVYDLRAFCALHSNLFEQALSDAQLCTTLNPDWSRGWARLGTAQLCCSHATAALSAYERGLRLDPNNKEMKLGVTLAQEMLKSRGGKMRRAAEHD